jgi:uncharacterized DUF497 family protein
MALRFSWDPKKAASNLKNHRVSFEEAVTAFGDPLSMTIPDPLHSESEERFVLIGLSANRRLWLLFTPSAATTKYESSALGSPAVENGLSMKKASKSSRSRKASRQESDDEMLPEYDFSTGVRNKYAERYAEGTNLVLLEPDLAEQFPDSESVSRALRAYLKSRAKRRSV